MIGFVLETNYINGYNGRDGYAAITNEMGFDSPCFVPCWALSTLNFQQFDNFLTFEIVQVFCSRKK